MVSIIIPYYNRVNSLLRTISSVFNQSVSDWELILINDYSSENIEPVNSLNAGPQNQKLIHLSNSRNEGPGFSRNRGIDISNGNFLVFLDSDDYLLPDFLKFTLEAITSDALFVYSQSLWDNSSIYKTSNIKYDNVLFSLLKYSRPWHTSSILWNRKYIARFKDSLKNWEDYLFEFESGLNRNKIIHVNKPLCIIGTVNELSLSSLEKTLIGLNDRLTVLDSMMFLLSKYSLVMFSFKIKILIILKFSNLILFSKKYKDFIMPSLKSWQLKLLPNNRLFLTFFIKLLSRFV